MCDIFATSVYAQLIILLFLKPRPAVSMVDNINLVRGTFPAEQFNHIIQSAWDKTSRNQ